MNKILICHQDTNFGSTNSGRKLWFNKFRTEILVQQIQNRNFGSTNSGQKFWARNFFSTNLGHKLWINKFRTHTLKQKVNHTKFRTQTLVQDFHLIFSLAPNPKHPPFSSHVFCGKKIVVICILRVNLDIPDILH